MPSSVIVGSYSNCLFRVLKNSIPGKEIMGRWFERKEYMYTYGLFMLRFERKQQNSEKQLPLRKKKKRRRRRIKEELLTVFNSGCISFLIFMCSSGSESHSVGSSSLQPHRLYSPWNSPGQNTGVNNLFLLHGIIPTQGSKPGLQHCRQTLYQLSHQGSLFYKSGLLYDQTIVPFLKIN